MSHKERERQTPKESIKKSFMTLVKDRRTVLVKWSSNGMLHDEQR